MTKAKSNKKMKGQLNPKVAFCIGSFIGDTLKIWRTYCLKQNVNLTDLYQISTDHHKSPQPTKYWKKKTQR